MKTTLYEVKTEDGRTSRVFCANSKQHDRFREVAWKEGNTISTISNGIHTIKQFEQFIKTLN